MAPHRIYFDGDLRQGTLEITGEEAHHAVRVKRVATGDQVQVLDGRGHVAAAAVAQTSKAGQGWRLRLELEAIEEVPRVSPTVEVCSPAPKGQRLADLIDGLSQVGAARWSLLDSERSAGEPRPGKLDRLTRTAAEASKQCGRAWLLEIGEGIDFGGAIAGAPVVILADASGPPYRGAAADSVRLLIGPEGGWSPRELEQARAAGVRVASFGPHAMRIELAAVVAAGIILDVESRAQRTPTL